MSVLKKTLEVFIRSFPECRALGALAATKRSVIPAQARTQQRKTGGSSLWLSRRRRRISDKNEALRFPQGDNFAPRIALSWWSACLMVLFSLNSALAGHGFMTAFGNIEWLPEPGRTPDSAWYKLDAVREEGQLLLAGDSAEKLQLCLSFAREKLAELEAMIKAENTEAAQVAADHYLAYLTRAKTLIDEQAEQTQKETLAETMVNALLEHRYILSVDYPELPASTRAPLLAVAAHAGEQYQEVVQLLPKKKKGALFFKEEEVRWSLQMAERADEEGEAENSQQPTASNQ